MRSRSRSSPSAVCTRRAVGRSNADDGYPVPQAWCHRAPAWAYWASRCSRNPADEPRPLDRRKLICVHRGVRCHGGHEHRDWLCLTCGVSTPRLVLRSVTDELRNSQVAARGIHDPAALPFSEPWTAVEAQSCCATSQRPLRYLCVAEPKNHEQWPLNLAAHDENEQLTGSCSLESEHVPIRRTAPTRSWIGRQFQGRRLGREMCRAAPHPTFVGPARCTCATRAWHDNTASLSLTRSLPYTEERADEEQRRDPTRHHAGVFDGPPRWQTVRRNDIDLTGIEPTLDLLCIPTHKDVDSHRDRRSRFTPRVSNHRTQLALRESSL